MLNFNFTFTFTFTSTHFGQTVTTQSWEISSQIPPLLATEQVLFYADFKVKLTSARPRQKEYLPR